MLPTAVAADAGVLSARLVFGPDESLRTCEVPGLSETVVRALPGLRAHRCDNDAGLTFVDELRDTELAHLVEHVALEVMAMAGSSPASRGDTSWDFAADGRGVFRVRIAYNDKAVARGALAFACDLVNALVGGAAVPDAEAEARRLRKMRER
jgi:hypothetical protein